MSEMSRVFDILPIVDLGNKQSRNLVFFLAGFPDNQISGWGPAIQNIVDLQSCRLILMSLPGLEDGGKIPSWGYTCQEILALMHNTILTFAPNDDHRVKLVVHDWGSFYGLAYENLHPEKVEKMIVLDVGILRKPPLFDMVRILLYQWWFCVAFIASQLLHFHVGNIIFGLFGLVPSILLVCPHDKLPRRRRDINVHMCYLYFQFWKCMFVDRKSLPKTNFPTCPILFMYGMKKNVMFHDQNFLRRLESTPGCKYLSVANAGHWISRADPELFLMEFREFFQL